MLRSFRYLFFPISIIYGLVVWIRNWLFDKNVLKSSRFNFPVICIGNLAVGGTGKTPMVEYLARLLKDQYQVATLSRGYKRKTVGFGIANENTTALEIGDEPMQFHQKFPTVTVAVGEERLVAIPQLLHDRPDTQLIILDDAFQHRTVRAGLNIILTEHRNLYTRDFFLPAGDLRDTRQSAGRADIIVVTKCTKGIGEKEKKEIIEELNPKEHQQVFFTEVIYGKPYHLFSRASFEVSADLDTLLVCGIANPKPLQDYLDEEVHSYEMLRYPDHHIFTIDNLDEIKKQFGTIASGNKIILTTEKDAVRLQKFENQLMDFPIYVIPIEHAFLFGERELFEERVTGFVARIKPAGGDELAPVA
ncbi:MAG: tetraacyldisaccharide 4'-kinase [Bacteroidota bacterium]|nr:tetraacyldisaccharide 4'-kinase [Ferruginibacter sp.]